MDQIIDLVEFRGCHKCRAEDKGKNQYCKSCIVNTDTPNTRFFSYQFKKSKYTKKPTKVEIEYPKPSIQNLSIVYYISPLEKSIFTNLNQTRFRNLDHLTSYIVYSNQVPLSQFVFHLAPELKKIPQIQLIISKNLQYLPFSTDCLEDGLPFSQESGDLDLIYRPSFWKDLIRLYIDSYQHKIPLFSLKYFDPCKISQSLLIAIYFSGYQYREEQPIRLSEYMNGLFETNFKKIFNKPSVQNVQALFVYMHEYFIQGKTSLTRACLAQITRMCYMLGIHIDTHRFEESCNFNRKIIIRQVASFDQLLSGSFRFYPSFVGEPPKYDPTLHDPSLYMLPDYMLEFGNFQANERILKSNLTNIRNYFIWKAQGVAQFNYNSSTTTDNSEKLCIGRLNSLQEKYNEINCLLSLLKMQFQNNLTEIEQLESNLSFHYLHFSLIILEYSRLHKSKLSSELLAKTLNYCRQISDFIQNDPNPEPNHFYCYLISFTYMSIYKHLSKDDKNSTIRELKIMKGSLSKKVNEFDNLNNLLFTTAFKKIELG